MAFKPYHDNEWITVKHADRLHYHVFRKADVEFVGVYTDGDFYVQLSTEHEHIYYMCEPSSELYKLLIAYGMGWTA